MLVCLRARFRESSVSSVSAAFFSLSSFLAFRLMQRELLASRGWMLASRRAAAGVRPAFRAPDLPCPKQLSGPTPRSLRSKLLQLADNVVIELLDAIIAVYNDAAASTLLDELRSREGLSSVSLR